MEPKTEKIKLRFKKIKNQLQKLAVKRLPLILISVGSCIFPLELRHHLHSLDQHWFIHMHCGTAATSIISRIVPISTMELQQPLLSLEQCRLTCKHCKTVASLFSFDHYRLVYMHCGTATTAIFSRTVSARLYETWNCSSPYFLSIIIDVSICTVERVISQFSLGQYRLINMNDSLMWTLELQRFLFSLDQCRLD